MRKKAIYIFFSVFAFAVTLLVISIASDNAAFYISDTVCIAVRNSLAFLTSPFRFSVFELLVFLSPILLFFALRYLLRGKGASLERFLLLVSLLSFVFSLYVFTLGIPQFVQFEVSPSEDVPTEAELIGAAEYLIDDISKITAEHPSPSDPRELYRELSNSYSELGGSMNFSFSALPIPKPLKTSRLASCLGVLALYSFPTGEINLNLDIPDYMLPFTLSHEYAHFIGAANEGVANYIAFLACVGAKNPYVRYSGELSALEYILSDVSKIESDSYNLLYGKIPQMAVRDMSEYREYCRRYSKSFFYKLSDRLNSAHLNLWDSSGKTSYSCVSKYVTHYLNSTYNDTTV